MFKGNVIQMLGFNEMARYLWRQLCVHNSTEMSIEHILRGAWAFFMKLKDEFCTKHFCCRQRHGLFDAECTSVACFRGFAWTMTKEPEHRLSIMRRKMVRIVFVFRRHSDTHWVTCTSVQESDAAFEQTSTNYALRDWITVKRQSKGRFAGKTALSADKRW